MASILYGGPATDIRGSSGGNTFSRNASGAFMCRRTKGIRKNTAEQSVRKGHFATISSSWKMLTEEQRQAWILAAPNYPRLNRFGQPITLTGQQAYMLINTNIQLIGSNLFTDPPVWTGIDTPVISSIQAQNGSPYLQIHFATTLEADVYQIIYASQQLSPGVNFISSKLKLIDCSTNGAVSDLDISDLYITKFGTLFTEGCKIFVSVANISPDTGQRSGTAISSGIIQPT